MHITDTLLSLQQRCEQRISYADRIKDFSNPTAKKLLAIMERKQTNLCVAADVTSCKELLSLVRAVGDHICMLKTHIDILHDFHPSVIKQLKELAIQHDFLIFEDRKFADIGTIVLQQYEGGIYHISDWADIVNAHTVPGPGIITGLKSVGLAKGRGLLLLAQMSSIGSLAHGEYTRSTIAMAQQESEFVIGFIAREYVASGFLHFTPGVQLHEGSDSMGQQYITPEQAIKAGSDVIIVGRGMYQADNVTAAAAAYKVAGWSAYQAQL
ncbi:MAG TPA: orotidine-5'-phosphate decarboxylase [Candidatus Babeliales bacterium]|nr:orotidine-5'-phosphate decarboxylase [Candidatus Babeliales bacterium]